MANPDGKAGSPSAVYAAPAQLPEGLLHLAVCVGHHHHGPWILMHLLTALQCMSLPTIVLCGPLPAAAASTAEGFLF